MACFARQTERSGGQKGKGLGEGIFVHPRFPPPPNSCLAVVLAKAGHTNEISAPQLI